MTRIVLRRLRVQIVFSFWLTLLLTACGGTSGSSSEPVTTLVTPPPQTSSSDTTPPVVQIMSPTTGTSYTATTASVNLTGIATDNAGLAQISWSNSLGGSGSTVVSGTTTNWNFSVALQSGANVIAVTARDTSGNNSRAQLTVNYAPNATNTATLSWGANTEPDLGGYRVYYGTAPGMYLQSYGQGINVGNTTTYTLTGLNHGVRYYFVVTAYDNSSNESGYSNEVFKDVP